MPKIDVVDEAIIDSPPSEVFNAILEEYAGVTRWWMPHFEGKLKGEVPIGCVGAVCEMTGHTHGVTARFSVKIVKIEQDKSIEMELKGDFVGFEKYTFEPSDGQTKIRLHYVGATNRLLFSVLSPFVNPEKQHSDTIQKGFKACNSYLCKKQRC
jgi:uncharacterized protein YndB with AHSA1/START domain